MEPAPVASVAILSAPTFVVAFLWLSAAFGRRIQGWLGVPSVDNRAARATTAVALGAGLLQLIPFTLGAVGLLDARYLWLSSVVVAALLFSDLRRTLAVAWSWLRNLRLPGRWGFAWAAALSPGILVAVLLALAPTTDTDGLWYHLTVPKRWLESGQLHYLPTYPNSNMPMGVELLFGSALALAGDSAAKLLHFALGACGAIGLYFAGAQLKNRTVGIAAAVLYLVGPIGVGHLLGWAFIEGATSFATIAAVSAWIAWYETRAEGWLRCAFLLAGIGVSFKITAGLVPLGLAGLTLAAHFDRRPMDQPRRVRLAALLPLLICVAPVTPWLVRADIMTGNPFFPLFASHIPSRDFAPELATQWGDFNRYLNWAIVIGRDWSIERRQLILVGCAAVMILVAGVACLFLGSRRARTATLVLLATMLAQLGAVGLYVRYWIPIAAVLSLPLLMLIDKAISGKYQRIAMVIVAAVLSLTQARRGLLSVNGDVAGLVRSAFGAAERRAFLLRQLPPFPLYDKINRDLPHDSKLLLAFYCGGFYIDRTTYCTEIVQGSIRMTSWEAFSSDIRRLGVTHVLTPRKVAEGGPAPPVDAAGVGFMVQKQEWALIGRLLAQNGQLVASAGADGLYRLNVANELKPQ